MAAELTEGLGPAMAFALVGACGVGAQWLAWRLRLPAIVLMLAAGLVIGPGLGLLIPARDFGALTGPLISLAVAVILFEGGLSLDLHRLGDARAGVARLVLIGAPLGWLFSTLALVYAAGLSWETATVFGGILIVTGPTVIAPLLRQARLARRPAQLLQWEAIVNDPIGALAAVLAFEVVLVLHSGLSAAEAALDLALGIGFAAMLGAAAGYFGIARAFRRGLVPEYMKVPVLFVTLLAVFALSDAVLHESGLLAVTVMGLVIANADLPSMTELRRFKEHATVLLVSGVFILLAAGLDVAHLAQLDWRAAAFVAVVVLLARPATVVIALLGTALPWRERAFIALTGPRGVVLVAVAGLFGQRLAEAGITDGARIGPLAFLLVLATVVLHGFTLAPLARRFGLAGTEAPGLLIVGGSRFTTQLAETLVKAEVPVLITDPNHAHLIRPRAAGLRTFYGDVLGEAAEDSLELLSFGTVLAATDNDAYNTLVATDLAPELGRDAVWQIARHKEDRPRHTLPKQLGGRPFGAGRTLAGFEDLLDQGWRFRLTRLTAEYGLDDWRAKRPGALALLRIDAKGALRFVTDTDTLHAEPGHRILALLPPAAQNAPAVPQPAADAPSPAPLGPLP
ncbi:MAG: sodium:proton antiporter [Paracoccaceae bacterium]|nr:sodium:proton antiporter [Paracoccaceae bacterium]